MDLTITPVYAHDAIVVHLGGKIDTGGAAALRQHFLHLFAAGHFRLVADLRHVTFLDAAGINVLLDTHAQAQSRRGFLRLAGSGFPHAGDPHAAVREAGAYLAEVEDLATRLRHAWRRAQHAITGLVIDPRPSGEVARHG